MKIILNESFINYEYSLNSTKKEIVLKQFINITNFCNKKLFYCLILRSFRLLFIP